MAITTRSKYKQMLEKAEEAAKEELLVQEITDDSENDSNYEGETELLSDKSFVTIQDINISDDNTISDISDLNIIIDDGIEINKQSLLEKEKKPPTKVIRPKKSWVWKFFQFNENNTKTICQINGCKKMLAWCGSPS